MRKATALFLTIGLFGCPSDDADDTGSTSSDSETTDSTTTGTSTSDSTTDGTTAGTDSSTGTGLTTTDTTTSTTTTTDGSTGGSGSTGGGGALEMCLDAAESDCGTCACNNCLPETLACEGNEGCVAVRDCARENMCSGIDCLGPCGDVIDMYGGIAGEAVTLAGALSDCVEAGCMTECAG